MENKMFNDILDAIISNATVDEIELIREKLNQYMINQNYNNDVLEELSDKNDGSLCPICHGEHVIKYGKDKKGNQRFLCKDCRKIFSVLTGTLLAYTKKQPYQWYAYIEALFNNMTLIQSAKMVGICEQTALVWRHKILSVLTELTKEDPVLSGIVYLDEKLAPVNHVGIKTDIKILKKNKRGISNQKRNIACAIDEHGNKVIQVSERGRIHSDTLIEIYKDKIPSSCTVVSDSLRSYHQLMKSLKVKWIKIPSGKKEKDGFNLDKINHLHSSIALFLHKYRGISDKYLENYIALYKIKDRFPYYFLKHVLSSLFKSISNSSCTLRFRDFESTFSFSSI